MTEHERREEDDLLARYRRNAARLRLAHGGLDLLRPVESCGVGLVAEISAQPSRRVVEMGMAALAGLSHRGAVDADGKSGDGAGILLRLPQEFFHKHILRTGHRPTQGLLAVGMVFLPRSNHAAQERCRTLVESHGIRMGHKVYGWRHVPIVLSALGSKAEATRPEIEQIMIENARGLSEEAFERDLYVMRRRIEKDIDKAQIRDFYICSLSCRSIVYKGLFLAEQLGNFYPDLSHPLLKSDFAIYHQRFSTNTFPDWWLAQPFRVVAHNGEVNTLKGNIKWMASHEAELRCEEVLGYSVDNIKPVLPLHGSDSACLDAAFELLLRCGYSLPEAKSLLIPEAWEQAEQHLAQNVRDFYRWCNGVMQPWDGPAAVCAFDGRWALAAMDRNGLRPLRYLVTEDGLLVSGSETGLVSLQEESIVEKGHVAPGEMIAVDLQDKRLVKDRRLKDSCASARPYGEWGRAIRTMALSSPTVLRLDKLRLRRCQAALGWTFEEIELILKPMADTGQEPTGSMGDDGPLAVLSDRARALHHFFRQDFSQVTNPPIDSLRERRVMDLRTRIGNFADLAQRETPPTKSIELDSPFLTCAAMAELKTRLFGKAIGSSFSCARKARAGESIRAGLTRTLAQSEHAVRSGRGDLFFSDRAIDSDRAGIPMPLLVSAVHSRLQKQGLRSYASINVESGQALDVHSCAVLLGMGATTVAPWLAEATLDEQVAEGEVIANLANYHRALEAGLLKIMSKMGIAVLSSYRGAMNFEAVGLSRTLVEEYFPGLVSRISGIGLGGLESRTLDLHKSGFSSAQPVVPIGGFYRLRRSAEPHAWQGEAIHLLQKAVAEESRGLYNAYCESLAQQEATALRDLLDFDTSAIEAVPLAEVESVTHIRRRLVSPGISHGALSAEAHETLAVAMNRIGAKSDSGEGGEDPSRYKPRANGDNASSAIKQIASGRFGVTAEYLNNCQEIEIKMAQGAKPGEGGQLPGHKVSVEIARLRGSMPGVTLISPPPHHDIYSIEDLAQLIYDLKQINPEAEVCVKLVARTGIGTIAAGVAKAHADTILISGHSGGTGASPQSSIKHAGLPWEIGLAETHQVLSVNGFRNKVRLRVDGGLKRGRDIVVAAILGAEEFGIGTGALVAMGCLMVRQCHANTCPVGICTQDTKLRAKFIGTPQRVINLFSFIAEEVREILASLGARCVEEVIGRTELLTQISRGDASLDDLDMNSLLARVETGKNPLFCTRARGTRNAVAESLDVRMIADAMPLFEDKSAVDLRYTIRNTDRTIGAGLASKIVRTFGMAGLAEGHVRLRFDGTAGQSFGAWAVGGMRMLVEGEANDYVGKGLSGGVIVLRPPRASTRPCQDNAIVGNTVLYGATAGKFFAAGRAGERFAIRNSGAVAVVEGCGSNGCEYMTGGEVVVLGPIGDNFAAGMTGGMAFLYDSDSSAGGVATRYNPAHVDLFRLGGHWQQRCLALIEMHARETRSLFAQGILANWEETCKDFWHVVPKEILHRLSHPIEGEPLESLSLENTLLLRRA